jgi:hypothetical protein
MVQHRGNSRMNKLWFKRGQKGEVSATSLLITVVVACIAVMIVVMVGGASNISNAISLLTQNGYTILGPGVPVGGNLLPSVNNTYNVGSTVFMWKNGYFSGNITSNGNTVVTGTGTNNTIPKWNGANSILTNSSLSDNGTHVVTTEPFVSGNQTAPNLDVTNIIAAQINGQAVPSGALVGYTNRLAGIILTPIGFNNDPTSLANATDGNFSTNTTYGNTSVLNGAVSGLMYFDMGAIYNVNIRMVIVDNVSVSGAYEWQLMCSQDAVTYIQPIPSPMGSVFAEVAGTQGLHFIGNCYARCRYIYIALVNSSGSPSLVQTKITEIQAIDDGY